METSHDKAMERDRRMRDRVLVARERFRSARERAQLADVHAHEAVARARALSQAEMIRRKLITARLEAVRGKQAEK